MVHDIKPPFLDGRIIFTKQLKAVSIVKDPTSDFVKYSKTGSAVVKRIREEKDRSQMREKFWELAGSKLGDILKVQKEPSEGADDKL